MKSNMMYSIEALLQNKCQAERKNPAYIFLFQNLSIIFFYKISTKS